MFQRISHDFPAFAVVPVETIDVAGEMPVGEEQRGGQLIVRRWVAQHQAPQLPGFFNQTLAGDQIAEPQTRCETLGQAADIDNAAGSVEP